MDTCYTVISVHDQAVLAAVSFDLQDLYLCCSIVTCSTCYQDGSWSAINRSCTLVRDFTDLCFHSYFSLMDDMLKDIDDNDWRLDVKYDILPFCFLSKYHCFSCICLLH